MAIPRKKKTTTEPEALDVTIPVVEGGPELSVSDEQIIECQKRLYALAGVEGKEREFEDVRAELERLRAGVAAV